MIMKVLKIIIVMLVLIMSVGAVCAADSVNDVATSDDGQDTLQITQDESYAASESSFADLDKEIKSSGMVLDLTKDYTFNNETDDEIGINISRDNFVLNGEGHTLDGNLQSRIFVITGNNITISNINFINGNRSDKSGGAIYVSGSLTLNNVTFHNNYAQSGGAIFLNGNITINDALFSDNQAEEGGAVCIRGDTIINNAIFNSNIGITGGALYVVSETTISNSTFNKNRAKSGGAVSIHMDTNISNSNFSANQAEEYGGAILIKSETIINNSVFDKNKAPRGGAIQTEDITKISNTTFSNNRGEFAAGAIFIKDSDLKTNNSIFINNTAREFGGAIVNTAAHTSKKDKFINNHAGIGDVIYCESNTDFTLSTGTFISDEEVNWGLIHITSGGSGKISNTTFSNIKSNYSTAVYFENSTALIDKCTFINLTAKMTAGAIGFKNIGGMGVIIRDCRFSDVKSEKNGGAVFVDISGGNIGTQGTVLVFNSRFTNCTSEYGGAYMQLSGNLIMTNTTFNSNKAKSNGGASYLSFVTAILTDCKFDSNVVPSYEDYTTYGGGLYGDFITLTMSNCIFENNYAELGNAIYELDSNYTIKRTTFFNNSNAIYSDFDIYYDLENNTYNNDTISLNNKFYTTIITQSGVELESLNNTIDVTTLPSKFDLRDWGWVSSVKNQGRMGSCWTFGPTGALESALLKTTGIEADFSENNMQNTMLRYSKYGYMFFVESGTSVHASSYLLSWLGAFTKDYDSYDQLGKVSPILVSDECVHVQDIMFIPNNVSDVKSAILQFGSLDANIYAQSTFNEKSPYYYPKTYSQYCNETMKPTHSISIVGWDDNFSRDNFYMKPEGDGAWICKNSWGTDWGDNGYFYVSYYDKTLCIGNITDYNFMAMILENTEVYDKNYQHAITWEGEFYNKSNSYANKFVALGNDALEAVGTYFEREGINYTIEIIVNDEKVLTQEGVSPFFGFHTIKLNESIPLTAGDEFLVVINSSAVPYIENQYTRVHYDYNMTYVYENNQWVDFFNKGNIAFIKAYTKDLAIYTKDLVKIYKNDTMFEANVGVANQTVTFEINGRNYTRTSDANGTARISVNLNPGNYTIKTSYKEFSAENNITILPTLLADNLVKYFRNASQFYISLVDTAGNPVAGKNITMNINGVFYNRLTNKNGTAKLNINLEPGEYILTAIDPLTGLQMSYNITVLPVLSASDLEMKYKDGSTFNAMVLDGQGKPMANAAVKFNVNGVFYTRYTNSSGIAKLNINLMAGKYIITSEFDGMRISNTITIKD